MCDPRLLHSAVSFTAPLPAPRTHAQRRARQRLDRKCSASLANPVPHEVIVGLCDARPTIAHEPDDVKHGLAYLAWCSRMQHRRHRELPEYFSIHNQELEKRFFRKGFEILNERHDLIEVVDAARRGLTRAYRLKPDVEEAIRSRLKKGNDSRSPLTMILPSGKRRASLPDAVALSSLHHRETDWRNAPVNSLAPADLDALDRLDTTLLAILRLPEDEQRLALQTLGQDGESSASDLLNELDRIRSVARTEVAGVGFIPHEYSQGSTGRLFAVDVNLQSASRIIKRAALNGLVAYDFSNCHFSILYQLALREGVELPAVRELLADKRGWRSRIGAHCGMSEKLTKLCFIRLGYGASQDRRRNSPDSITELIGRERADLFYAYPDVKRLKGDLHRGRLAILKTWPLKHGRLLNAMGLPYKPDTLADGEKDTPATQLAHILQGFEARMLWIVVTMYGEDIVLLEHDGWTARRTLDTEAICRRIREETDLDMTLEEERIKAPC
jgi:hypothetical protein